MLKALCLSVWLGLSLVSGAQAASVVFLNPGNADETFWVSYSRFMQGAAQNLGMSLRVEYSGRDRQRVLHQARQALQGPQRPDYLVLVNEQYVAPEIIRLSRGSGVRLFLVNNGLTVDQARQVHEYPDRYPPVLGTLTGNDEEAGYRMLKTLVEQLPPAALQQGVDLLAFSGLKHTPAAQLREQGMHRALAELPGVHLRQLVYGEWSRQRAYEQAQLLGARYPRTQLVWSANDEMAFGAMQAFEEAGRVPGRDVLFSAVNSSPQALQARIEGRLSVLMGGHFSLGGWAMVLLHDDAQGVPIGQLLARPRPVPVLQLIDAVKARRWLTLEQQGDYGLDFKGFSAVGKAPGYRYPFLKDAMDY
ncbi:MULTISPECIES: ABC transporter substrate-binding protein [unclassified Pseudomonas]|uniref:ABC transporter substrate-binding protein n=1 Tax=Pseudomonas TaxID=286 RepID=UPI001E61BA77|nr:MULTISPECIES: ABC transporter substrate-binding protein [unclassified Pseudomonas]MCO7505656.1 ABC transporter substrate-binding protein [Pseudomonas sp. VE 267-6A]MCO7533034.1 ABC transporter substrate-binding protein [Pseudomonas sp. 2]